MTLSGFNTPVKFALITAAETANAATRVNSRTAFLNAGCTLRDTELKLVKMVRIVSGKFAFLLIHPVNSGFCFCHPLLLHLLRTTLKTVVLFVIAVLILLLRHPLLLC